MSKSYYDEDPLHGNGKATIKPVRIIGNRPAHYRRLVGWRVGSSPENTKHNSHVRQSKKERITERDWTLAQTKGWDWLSDHRNGRRLNRAMAS